MVLRLTCNFGYFLHPFWYGLILLGYHGFPMSPSNKEARTMLGPEFFLGQMICGFVSKGEKQDHSEQQGFNHVFDSCRVLKQLSVLEIVFRGESFFSLFSSSV